MRTVFMGSPEFAVPSLLALCEMTDVVAVVTQPDKPKGRGLSLAESPVKLAARERSLPVLQPASLRPDRSNFLGQLRALGPELVVVVAYGKILPPLMLTVSRHGCWNVHASLLPGYRGAAPIQWALLRGARETGVTLMQMDAGMDTGPMLLRRSLQIREDDTAGTLHDRLSRLGADLLREGLRRLLAGDAPVPVPQDDMLATRAPLLEKEHGLADFTRGAAALCDQVRGVDPWPGAYTTVRGRQGEELALKLFQVRVSSGSGAPGEVLGVDRDGLHVACGASAVAIGELQLPGRRRLPAQDLCAGFPLHLGTILGDGKPNPRLD